MAIHMLGSGGRDLPFDRTFFNVTLGDLVEQNGKEQGYKLSLYLLDGTIIEVCRIDKLADQYLILRTYRGKEEACDTGVNLVPYGLIYRIELSPRGAEEGGRMGFHWAPLISNDR